MTINEDCNDMAGTFYKDLIVMMNLGFIMNTVSYELMTFITTLTCNAVTLVLYRSQMNQTNFLLQPNTMLVIQWNDGTSAHNQYR